MKVSYIAGLSLLCAIAVPARAGTPDSHAARRAAETARLTASLRATWASRVAAGQAPRVIIEPSLVAGRVLTHRVLIGRPPGIPELQLEIDAGTVGASYVSVIMTSPSGTHTIFGGYASVPLYPPQSRHTRITLQVNSPFSDAGFGTYTEAGNWTVQQVSVQSEDGNSTNYSGSELAQLFPDNVVAIVNGSQDITPPTAGTGSVLTASVSLSSASPVFAASLAVADNLSGVESVGVNIVPPGTGFPLSAYTDLSAPVYKGTVYPAVKFNSNSAIGTYTISGFTVCDYAGNCLSDDDAADVKATFGTTTFEVTQ